MKSKIAQNLSYRFFQNFGSKCDRPFPRSLVPLFQNESKCEIFHTKMSSACSFIFMQIKVIFIRMVSHLDSLWNRGTRELRNGLFTPTNQMWKFVFTTLDKNWIEHVLYLSACSCDAMYRMRESNSKLELFYRMFYQTFLPYFFGPRLE